MSNSSKRFCPLRSTAAKTAECSEDCMWYIQSDNDCTCVVPLILTTQGTFIDVLEEKKK